MTYWLKLGYPSEVREDVSYWEDLRWVSDSPGRTSTRWSVRRRPRHGETYPPWGPQYAVGDLMVMYLTGDDRCPAILEVIEPPRWDPEEVDDAWPGEGDRWGVVTVVECKHAASDGGPSLGTIGVRPSSISQQGHVTLSVEQFDNALHAVRGKPLPSGRARTSGPSLIPVETVHVEGYQVHAKDEIRKAERREAQLVHDYVEHLRHEGDSVSRYKLPLVGRGSLYCDVFNETRNQLIEAKAISDRSSIRMAIGQLADYRRFISPTPSTAVLLEARPVPDLLDLLASQGVTVIWRDRDAFADTASGAFV